LTWSNRAVFSNALDSSKPRYEHWPSSLPVRFQYGHSPCTFQWSVFSSKFS